MESKKSIRIVIVDDSVRYRAMLRNLLESEPRIEIIGEAVNGIKGLELIWNTTPDVILMDLEMPLMDGMTALQHLMIHVPTPTIMFSRLTGEGTARCFDALKNGAVDFFGKDVFNENTVNARLQDILIEKVINASKMAMHSVEPTFSSSLPPQSGSKRVKTLVFCEECGSREEIAVMENEDQGGVICTHCGEYISLRQRNKYRRANCLSLIVAGEGGYGNLLRLIPHLRQDMNGAVLVIVHGSMQHIEEFTRYLDAISTVTVTRAGDGITLQGGNCYIGSDRENIHLNPYSGDYSLKFKEGDAGDGRSVNDTIASTAAIFKERAAVLYLSGRYPLGEAGVSGLIKAGGTAMVLDPGRCLYTQMGESILQNYNALSFNNEETLAWKICALHGRYRDSIVMA